MYADERDFFQEGEIALLDEAATDLSFAMDSFAREADRVAAEEAARRDRELVDQMFESVPGVIYLYDENGRFRRWNQRFLDVTGYTAAEMLDARPLHFFHGGDVPLLAERIGRVLETGEGNVEAGFVSKDGTVTPYFFTGRRVELEGQPHLVGPEATELVHGFAIALGLEATEAELIDTVFPHPTVSEAMHESVLATFGRPLHI